MTEWQTIETAPKGEFVLVCTGKGIVGEARYEDDGFWWWAGTYGNPWASHIEEEVFAGEPAVYWMPLPEPPTKEVLDD